MSKIIAFDYEKCVGCRTCEMVCSLSHDKEVDPLNSRIRVVKWEESVHSIALNCRQCEDAPCQNICPTGAISRDTEIDTTKIDYDQCIGCRSCVLICPFGAMAFNTKTRKVFKCDLCQGDPWCVKFCAYGTLEFVGTNEMHHSRITSTAEKILMAQKSAEKQEP